LIRTSVLALIGALAIQTPPSLAVPATTAPALLDGRCEGDEWRMASRTPIRDSLELLLQQNDTQLMLCVPLPPESYGTMDLYVGSRSAPMPINLHASAQVGERQRTTTGWPEWVFGNQRGWYSPPVALSRSAVVDGKPQLTFGVVTAREVVIEKDKFGSGPWRMMIEIRAMGADKRGTAQFPAAATPDDPNSWAIVGVR
jgi:hypothetical protein